MLNGPSAMDSTPSIAAPVTGVCFAGISNGGISAFRIAARYPERVASLVVFPGFARSSEDQAALAGFDFPIAMFVGGNDPGWIEAMQTAPRLLAASGRAVAFEVRDGEDTPSARRWMALTSSSSPTPPGVARRAGQAPPMPDSFLGVITLRVITMRVEELAAETGLTVDTIRYYQGLGLIEAPERAGRTARYTEEHRRQVETVRRLAASGFTLAQIQRLTSEEGAPLLKALVDQTVGTRTLSKSELSEASGLPEPLIDLAVTAGLLDSIGVEDEPRFSEDAIPMLSAAAAILQAGIPLEQLTGLAIRHAQNVTEVVDGAIELFRSHVRPGQGEDPEALAELFQVLLAQSTRLVAQHFEQALVHRALERLRDSDDRALVEALLTAEAQRFVVSCEWR